MLQLPRKSHPSLGEIYFWTATIHNWYPLLEDDQNKIIIINSLKNLSDTEKITVFGFVIMPNHIHLLWKQNSMNGRETPKASFLKYTAHQLVKLLANKNELTPYEVNASNKTYEIWQRDSLAIEIYSRKTALQKLNYIHNNPVSGKWSLAKDDISYYFSSARYYEYGHDEFGFLRNVFHEFDGLIFFRFVRHEPGRGESGR